MTAGNYNFTIEQGATFSKVLTWKDSNNVVINLTGYTARMQIRETKESADVILSLTTENSRIALGGAAGTITLTIAATDTDVLTASSYVYDLELISGATVTRLIEGNILVSRNVTR